MIYHKSEVQAGQLRSSLAGWHAHIAKQDGHGNAAALQKEGAVQPMDRFHWPFMTAIVLLGMFAVFTVISAFDPIWVKPAKPVVKPRISHRPQFQKLLQEYALTLAEFPCPPESEDFGQSILVVQEPVLWNDASEPQSGDSLLSSFVWVLKSKQNQSRRLG